MKTHHRFVFPFFLVIALVLLAVAMPRSFGSAEDEVDQALAASKSWIAQIDAGDYETSYSFACDAMRDKVPQDRWAEVLKALRVPWGTVLDRKQTSHIYRPNGVPGLPGECMVITYNTSFRKMDQAVEEVILKWEGGKWRGAGYNAGPKQNASDASAAPAPDHNTVTHTDPHVHPEPQPQ
jgi:Protein of unknown function (DUF4019)